MRGKERLPPYAFPLPLLYIPFPPIPPITDDAVPDPCFLGRPNNESSYKHTRTNTVINLFFVFSTTVHRHPGKNTRVPGIRICFLRPTDGHLELRAKTEAMRGRDFDGASAPAGRRHEFSDRGGVCQRVSFTELGSFPDVPGRENVSPRPAGSGQG